MTKILVTGASGFVGKHLLSKLRKGSYKTLEANSSNGDVAETSTWSSFERTDILIHLAGSTFVPSSWVNPDNFMRTNLQGVVCALEYCRQHNARMIFLSSCSYGNPSILPTPESALFVANNPYGLSKKLAEDVCRFYSDYYGVKITILRPFNVYGSGQSVRFLVPSIINQVRTAGIIRVKDLRPKRDYIYVEDLVNAIIKAIALPLDFDVFNIGSGISYSVGELIEIIQDVMGANLDVHATGEERIGEIMETQADISHARNVLGWAPSYSLLDGLKELMS